MNIPHSEPRTTWAAREEGQNRTKIAASHLIKSLADPDVREALSGKLTRAGHPLNDYLLKPLEELPLGRQLLADLSAGKPVPTHDVRDLLQGINRALNEYQGGFRNLPKNALLEKNGNADYYDLVTPANGTTPHYLLHHGQRGKPENTDRYLSAEQRKALESTPVGMALKSTHMILGNEREL
jgi:hypothetical protein